MKKFSILSISLFALTILTCVSCGYLISTALISSNLFQFTSVVSFEKQTVYAISMNKSQNKKEVESKQADLQSKNGAGYIFQKEEYYHLLASVYENLNDAELVKTNLKTNNIETEILAIDLPTIQVEGSFSNDEKNILSNSIRADYDLFKSLYDVAISLDTGVFDKNKAKLECNTIFSKHVSTKTNFETFFKKQNLNKNLEVLNDQLENTYQILLNLVNEDYKIFNQTFSSLIKFTYCKILFE